MEYVDELDKMYESEVKELINLKEDERFDRTEGGQDSIGKKIAGFGTKNGGILLVGQKDFKNGGEIIGVGVDFQKELTQAISNVKPTPLTKSKTIKYESKSLALIQVKDVGQLRPCAYKKTFYERKSDSIITLQPEEVRRYHITYGGVNIENLPTHASKKDVDEIELLKYEKSLQRTKDNILDSITEKNSLTIRGVISLSKRPCDYLEGAFIEIQKYDNVIGSPPIPIGTSIKISKPASKLIDETAEIIVQNLPVERKYNGVKMIEKSVIPISVIREVITNAVAHRNYRSNEHIRIRIFADCFDVSNPAVVSEKMWQDILANHSTYHPNEGLYTFLNPKHLYEGKGEGIWKIREELSRLRRLAPEFKVIGDTPSSFYVKISLVASITKDIKMAKLYSMIKNLKSITSSKVMKQLGVSRVTAIRMLNRMAEEGLLSHEGTTRTSKYYVNKS